MDGKELAEEIGDSVNSGIDAEEFRARIQRQHNALQRYLFDQVLKQAIIALASTPTVDARNKRVVEESQEIADFMGWDYETEI